jgi:hypothetical protein
LSRNVKLSVLTVTGLFLILASLGMPLISQAMAGILPDHRGAKEPIDPYIDQIKSYQQELQRIDLPNETRHLVEEKLNSISILATQRAEGKARQPTRQTLVQATPAITGTDEKLPDGIDNSPLIPFSENTVTVFNAWRKTTDHRYYLIFAGYLTQNPNQGVLLVLHANTHDFKQYNTPESCGGVRVTEAKDTTIILQSTTRCLFYFDAYKELFVDSYGTPIPLNNLSSPTTTPDLHFSSTPLAPYP